MFSVSNGQNLENRRVAALFSDVAVFIDVKDQAVRRCASVAGAPASDVAFELRAHDQGGILKVECQGRGSRVNVVRKSSQLSPSFEKTGVLPVCPRVYCRPRVYSRVYAFMSRVTSVPTLTSVPTFNAVSPFCQKAGLNNCAHALHFSCSSRPGLVPISMISDGRRRAHDRRAFLLLGQVPDAA